MKTINMIKTGRSVRTVMTLTAGFAVAGSLAAAATPRMAFAAEAAQAPAASAPAFGSVNFDDAVGQSNAHKKDLDEMNALLATLRKVNISLTQGNASLQQGASSFMSDVEMRELAGLYENDQPSVDQKKRIAQLEEMANGRKAEMAKLESTPNPTEAQKARYTLLGNMRQQGDQNIQQLGQEFQDRLRKREEELLNKTIGQIRDAVASVAKSKGLTVVFDNKVAIYTANDITADVIKQANK